MLTFPTLPGISWPVKKTPIWNTQMAEHVSGREARIGLWQYPRYMFELTYDGVTSSSTAHQNLGNQSLQTLMDFYHQCQGMLNPFIFVDPSDYTVTAEAIGTGNGTNKIFTAQRSMGAGLFFEPVGWVTAATTVFVNGVSQPFTLTNPNTITMTTAPANATAITATFTYGFVCRWDTDEQEFREFMDQVWDVPSIKFKSVRQ